MNATDYVWVGSQFRGLTKRLRSAERLIAAQSREIHRLRAELEKGKHENRERVYFIGRVGARRPQTDEAV